MLIPPLEVKVAGEDSAAAVDEDVAPDITHAEFAGERGGKTLAIADGDWIFDARSIEVSVSDDGNTYTPVAKRELPAMKRDDADGIHPHALTFDTVNARYIRVKVASEHSIPEWHGGNGKPGFLFVDEIMVR